jgi:hypothetical protein
VRRLRAGRLVGPTLDAIGVLALGYIVLSFIHVHDYDLGLYRGGYLTLAVVTAVLLAVLAHPAARLGALIGRLPMLWLGLRSYSFYLWHWPVLVLTRPGIDVSMPRGVLIPLQLLVVLGLADLSYRFVELPFRGKAKVPRLPEDWLRVGRPALLVAVPAIVVLVGWSGLVATGSHHLQPGLAAASTQTFARVDVRERPRRRNAAFRRRGGAAGAKRAPRIVAFGDSVMIAAKDRFAARLGPRFSMNAEVNRQADEFVTLARRLKVSGSRPDDLIVHMGNNGPLYSGEMEELRKATSNAKQIFLVNDHAPVSWVGKSNSEIEEAAEDWPHTTLIDWASAAKSKDNLTWDGIHLTPAGTGVYTRLIVGAIRQGRSPAGPRAHEDPSR